MTDFHFTVAMSFALQAAAWFCAGAMMGAAYFLTLRWNVGLLVFGRAPFVTVIMQGGRLLLLAGLLAAIAHWSGALPLIAAAAAILATRTIMTMRLGVPT